MVVMVVAMILPVPMAFMHSPTLGVVIVVRMTPISSFIGRTFPTSRHPNVVPAIDSPVAVDPLVSCCRHRRTPFMTQRRGGAVGKHFALSRRLERQHGREQTLKNPIWGGASNSQKGSSFLTC